MMRIIFNNLEKSELVKSLIQERIDICTDRFPELSTHGIAVTLSMYNSPHQAGPDLFGIKIRITGNKYRNISLEKRSPNLYVATAILFDALLERLNRYGDKQRVKKLKQIRQWHQDQASADIT